DLGRHFMANDPETNGPVTTRRAFFGAAVSAGAGVAAACAPAATPAPAPSAAPAAGQAQWEKEWDSLVAAGKQEGTVSVITYPGSPFRKFMETFQTAVPGI